MRVFTDRTCSRCGLRTSFDGLASEALNDLPHVCPDGFSPAVAYSSIKVRVVYGPGERNRLPEERLDIILTL